MGLTYFFDFISQPSRAVWMFLKFSEVHFEPFPVNLLQGEHKTDRFMDDFSRFQRVPFIHDGPLRLNESIAVLRYVADKFNVDNQWYPKDLTKRAPIDEFLEWQHSNLRANCGVYLRHAWINPALSGKPVDEERVKRAEKALLKCFEEFERLFLENRNFIASDDAPTVADLFAISEILQLKIGGFDIEEKAPGLVEWIQRVQEGSQPYYSKAFAVLDKLSEKMAEKKAGKL